MVIGGQPIHVRINYAKNNEGSAMSKYQYKCDHCHDMICSQDPVKVHEENGEYFFFHQSCFNMWQVHRGKAGEIRSQLVAHEFE